MSHDSDCPTTLPRYQPVPLQNTQSNISTNICSRLEDLDILGRLQRSSIETICNNTSLQPRNPRHVCQLTNRASTHNVHGMCTLHAGIKASTIAWRQVSKYSTCARHISNTASNNTHSGIR